jgi:hypothetical protein
MHICSHRFLFSAITLGSDALGDALGDAGTDLNCALYSLKVTIAPFSRSPPLVSLPLFFGDEEDAKVPLSINFLKTLLRIRSSLFSNPPRLSLFSIFETVVGLRFKPSATAT